MTQSFCTEGLASPDRNPSSKATLEPFVMDQGHLALRIKQILDSTVSSSPAHAFARLLQGFLCFGLNDEAGARQVCMWMEMYMHKNSVLSRMSSVYAFMHLVNPAQYPQVESGRKPLNDVDVLGTVCFRWLIFRRQVAKLQTGRTDVNLFNLTVSTRLLFNNPVWRKESSTPSDVASTAKDDSEPLTLSTARDVCIESFISIGRKAAGMKRLSDADSGFSD